MGEEGKGEEGESEVVRIGEKPCTDLYLEPTSDGIVPLILATKTMSQNRTNKALLPGLWASVNVITMNR